MKNATIYQSKGMLFNSESGLAIIDFDIIKAQCKAKTDETVIHANIKSKDLDKLTANKHLLEFEVVRNLTASQLFVLITFSNKSNVTLFVTNSFPPLFKCNDNFLLQDYITIHHDEKETHKLKTTDMIVFKEYQMLENPKVTNYWFYVPTEHQSEMMKQIELISSIPNIQNKIIGANVYDIDKIVKLFTVEVEQQ